MVTVHPSYECRHLLFLNPIKLNFTLFFPSTEEWTSSKKVVRHKKRETETKVTRNIVMEDGVVIADSGPLVDSRSREEEHEEEEEGERKEDPKRQASSSSEFPRILPSGHLKVPGSDVIIDEVSSVKKTRNKTKSEHAQYHDESLNKLTGFEVHKKAITSPKELLVVQRETTGNSFQPKGSLSFYSVEGKTTNGLEERRERNYFDKFTGKRETDSITTTKQEIVEETEEPEEYAVNYIPETRRENQRHFYSYATNDEDQESKTDFNNKVLFINDRVHDQDNCCLTPDPDPVFFTKPLQALVRVRRETGGSSSSDSDSITRLDGNRIRIDLQQESRAPQSSSSPLPTQTSFGGNSQQNRTFYFGTNNNNQEF